MDEKREMFDFQANFQFFKKMIKFKNQSKIVRRDFTQLLIDAQTENYQETRDTESINLNKLRIEKKMSFEV